METITQNIEQQPFGYVVFDAETGALTESCFQVPPATHVGRLIEVDEDTRTNWLSYRANDARDGLEPITPQDPSPVVPQQVTMRQARLALLGAGMLSQVDAAIDSLPIQQKEEARIEWDFSSTVERNRPLVVMLGQALGLDDAGLDQLFITAAGL